MRALYSLDLSDPHCLVVLFSFFVVSVEFQILHALQIIKIDIHFEEDNCGWDSFETKPYPPEVTEFYFQNLAIDGMLGLLVGDGPLNGCPLIVRISMSKKSLKDPSFYKLKIECMWVYLNSGFGLALFGGLSRPKSCPALCISDAASQ